MIYDCKNMNPENKECNKIQEEEKIIADTSNKPFNKKVWRLELSHWW